MATLSGRGGSARTIVVVLVAIAGLVVVVAGAGYAVAAYNVKQGLDRRIEQYREDGVPVTLAELDGLYDQGPNAAERGARYAEIFATLPGGTTEGEPVPVVTSFPSPDEALSNAAIAESKEFLEAYRDAIDALHALGRDAAPVRYPGDAETWLEEGFTHLAPLRTAVQLLSLEALIAAVEGNSDAATRGIGEAISLSDSLRDEPLLISQLVRIACLDISFRVMEQIVNRVRCTDGQLMRLQRLLAELSLEGMIAHGLLGEASFVLADLGRSSSDVREEWAAFPAELQPPGYLLGVRVYRDLETLNLLRSYDEVSAIGDLGLLDRDAALISFEKSLDQKPILGNRAAKDFGTMMRGRFRAESRCIALRNAAIVASAGLRYYSSAGGVPGSLGELIPLFLREQLVDPFSGEPMLLRDRGAGFIAYSVGPDGDDDQGEGPSDESNINTDGDVAFRVLTMPQR